MCACRAHCGSVLKHFLTSDVYSKGVALLVTSPHYAAVHSQYFCSLSVRSHSHSSSSCATSLCPSTCCLFYCCDFFILESKCNYNMESLISILPAARFCVCVDRAERYRAQANAIEWTEGSPQISWAL